MRNVLTWLRRKISGPYYCDAYEPQAIDRWLFTSRFPGYEIVVSYEVFTYTYQFVNWFIPDKVVRHVFMQARATGDPPASIVKAVSKPVFAPVEGTGPETLTDYQRLRLSLFFNDVLCARAKAFSPS